MNPIHMNHFCKKSSLCCCNYSVANQNQTLKVVNTDKKGNNEGAVVFMFDFNMKHFFHQAKSI